MLKGCFRWNSEDIWNDWYDDIKDESNEIILQIIIHQKSLTMN